jgi:catalase (peroxidase I)
MTDSPHFPIADQIREAKSHQARAQQLLQLSDAALLGGHVDIEIALSQAGFAAGNTFVVWRVAALCRTRDAHGLLPEPIGKELEAWRETLSRIAAGAIVLTDPANLFHSAGRIDGE